MEDHSISVLIVDDHQIVLDGLLTRLQSKPGIEVVGTANDGLEAIQKAKTLRPDVILLDLTLPKMPGLQVLKMLRTETPKAKIVVYTMHDSKEYLRECLAIGAGGYILKSSNPNELLDAVPAVAGGKIVIDLKLLKSLKTGAVPLRQAESVMVHGENDYLTEKERQILQLIVKGCTPHEIADTLTLSYYTVTTHFKHIYKKLGVNSRSAVIAKALQDHLVEP